MHPKTNSSSGEASMDAKIAMDFERDLFMALQVPYPLYKLASLMIFLLDMFSSSPKKGVSPNPKSFPNFYCSVQSNPLFGFFTF